MRTREQKLRTIVEHEGQRYVDEPVYIRPKFDPGTRLERAVAQALGAQPRSKPPLLVGHERVRLRWVKPDGKGGFVPK